MSLGLLSLITWLPVAGALILLFVPGNDARAANMVRWIALIVTTIALVGTAWVGGLRAAVVTWSFFPVALLAIWTKHRRTACACLIWLIATYPLSAVWH